MSLTSLIGHYGRLHVIVRSYEPSVECYEREFDGRHCQQTLFGMHTSSNMMNWRPEGTPPIGRPNIFVPKSYSDRKFSIDLVCVR